MCCSEIVRDHLLALRWMNPNAIVYLREYKGQGPATIEYSLCKYTCYLQPLTPNAHRYTVCRPAGTDSSTRAFEVKPDIEAVEAVAKVLMAARDPDDEVASSFASAEASIGSTAAAVSGKQTSPRASALPSPSDKRMGESSPACAAQASR